MNTVSGKQKDWVMPVEIQVSFRYGWYFCIELRMIYSLERRQLVEKI